MSKYIDLEHTSGYITFVNTKVPDIGCDEFELDVRLEKPKSRRKLSANPPGGAIAVNASRGIENKNFAPTTLNLTSTTSNGPITNAVTPSSTATTPALLTAAPPITDLLSPLDASEITTFNQRHNSTSVDTLATPLDDFITITPQNFKSPANDYRSDDCNELIQKELDDLENRENARKALVSQSSVEVGPIPVGEDSVGSNMSVNSGSNGYYGEVRKEFKKFI